MDSQLKRGMLEACVLAAMRSGDTYGYKIIKDISPFIEISESTLYPILKRLELSGSVTTYSVEHNGRLRKYYRITSIGEVKIIDFLSNWVAIMRAYNFIKEAKTHE